MRVLILFLTFITAGCATTGAAYMQCVPYARENSGIEIYGNAYTWWDKAKSRYSRGNNPEPGAVLVLSKTNKLKYGHVAVVKKIKDKRKIEVAHANWGKDLIGRGNIYNSMDVVDVSKDNDWSRVRFWDYASETYGYIYPVRGFVYNRKQTVQNHQ